MYAATLEAELLVIDEFDTWSIGELAAYPTWRVVPEPTFSEDPFSDDA